MFSISQLKVKLVGISNYDIVDGKSTPILGLIWSIILRFQVRKNVAQHVHFIVQTLVYVYLHVLHSGGWMLFWIHVHP